jgi:hypothetical protein
VASVLWVLDKNIAVDILVFFRKDVGLQGVEHIGYVGALQGARSGAGRGPLGRGVKASKGPRWVQVSGSGGHGGCVAMQEGGSVVSCRVLASKPRWRLKLKAELALTWATSCGKARRNWRMSSGVRGELCHRHRRHRKGLRSEKEGEREGERNRQQ